MSNAERQKRYRDKKRNAQRDENVTRVTVEPELNAQADVLRDDLGNHVPGLPLSPHLPQEATA